MRRFARPKFIRKDSQKFAKTRKKLTLFAKCRFLQIVNRLFVKKESNSDEDNDSVETIVPTN